MLVAFSHEEVPSDLDTFWLWPLPLQHQLPQLLPCQLIHVVALTLYHMWWPSLFITCGGPHSLSHVVALTLYHISQVFLFEAMVPVFIHDHKQVPSTHKQRTAHCLKL